MNSRYSQPWNFKFARFLAICSLVFVFWVSRQLLKIPLHDVIMTWSHSLDLFFARISGFLILYNLNWQYFPVLSPFIFLLGFKVVANRTEQNHFTSWSWPEATVLVRFFFRQIPRFFYPRKIKFGKLTAIFSLQNLDSYDFPLFSALKIWNRMNLRYSQPWNFQFARFLATFSLVFVFLEFEGSC